MWDFKFHLRKTRIKLGLSQREFCERINIPLSTFKAWEKGKFLPSFGNYKTLIEKLENLNISTFDIERCYTDEKSKQ